MIKPLIGSTWFTTHGRGQVTEHLPNGNVVFTMEDVGVDTNGNPYNRVEMRPFEVTLIKLEHVGIL